jgi:hypothetical protein
MQIYFRADHLTDEVLARILEMGYQFIQRDTVGEGDHAVTVWELSNYEAGDWEKVERWLRDEGVDFRTEVVIASA